MAEQQHGNTAGTNGQGPEPKNKHTHHHMLHHKDVNHGAKSFAAGLNFYKLVWIFAIGSLLGSCIETLFVFLTTGKYRWSTGMVIGPFNQIYGMGALLFVVLLYPLRHKGSFVIFIASFAIGMVFEYSASWVQQLVFGSTSWDYSHFATNIGGRTNLLFGVGWGVLGLLFITHTWPFLSELIQRIPNKIGRILTIAIAVFFALDLLLSGAAVLRWRSRDEGNPATNAISRMLDSIYPDERMQKIYPTLHFEESEK